MVVGVMTESLLGVLLQLADGVRRVHHVKGQDDSGLGAVFTWQHMHVHDVRNSTNWGAGCEQEDVGRRLVGRQQHQFGAVGFEQVA